MRYLEYQIRGKCIIKDHLEISGSCVSDTGERFDPVPNITEA